MYLLQVMQIGRPISNTKWIMLINSMSSVNIITDETPYITN